MEIWGGIPTVLLFGDDYQLWPVIEEGVIQGYFKMTSTFPISPSTKMTDTQLLCQWGSYLFTQIMAEMVFYLNKITG